MTTDRRTIKVYPKGWQGEMEPVCIWDTLEILERYREIVREDNEGIKIGQCELEHKAVLAAEEAESDEWNTFISDIDAIIKQITNGLTMKSKNLRDFYYAEGIDMGWRKQQGFLRFKAVNGAKEILQKILPKTSEFSLKCYIKEYDRTNPNYEGKIAMVIYVAHHDSPAWTEHYYVLPEACLNAERYLIKQPEHEKEEEEHNGEA